MVASSGKLACCSEFIWHTVLTLESLPAPSNYSSAQYQKLMSQFVTDNAKIALLEAKVFQQYK